MQQPIRILTFDIEEWFNLLDIDASRSVVSWDSFERRIHENTEKILLLLQEAGCKATFFCLGWVANKYPELIKKIDTAGYEIGSHTQNHQLAYELTPQQFKDDLEQSLASLESVTGKKVRCFRVPGFSITESNTWVLDVLAQSGITVDSSIFPAGRGHGGFASFGHDVPTIIRTPSGDVKEFPINTATIMGKPFIFSGGGYFRLFPYMLIRRLMHQSPYVMTYFHPRDFDPGQPVLTGLSAVRRFKSYFGLSGALGKLRKLLRDFEFTDVAGAEARVDWGKVPVIALGASANSRNRL
jgi:polysaccharide deacetylase family protein (PEP-CTERM system associated)